MTKSPLIWGGDQSFYTGITNRKMTTVSTEELAKNSTKAKWLKVTGGQLDVSTAAYTSSILGNPKVPYIPVAVPGTENPDAPITLLYKTTEDRYLELGKKRKTIDESEDETEAMMALIKLAPELLEQGDVYMARQTWSVLIMTSWSRKRNSPAKVVPHPCCSAGFHFQSIFTPMRTIKTPKMRVRF